MDNRDDKGFGSPGTGPMRTVDRQILLMTGLSLAIALVLASLYPRPLTMAVFSGLLMLASIATVLTAMLLWQRPRLNSLNLWDKATRCADHCSRFAGRRWTAAPQGRGAVGGWAL